MIFSFSWQRLMAIIIKEFVQMRRDRLTFAMMIGIPLMQLILFGFAINTNPRYLPTAVVMGDYSIFAQRFIQGLQNTKYFEITTATESKKTAENLLATGEVLFVVHIPTNFTRNLIRNERPQILVEADATDPSATVNALSVVAKLVDHVFDPLFRDQLYTLQSKPTAVDLVTHAKYNPESITAYAIVPGLIGVVLTMTMVIITTLAITRERERGTMESLLSTPVRPIEVMIGKVVPYVIVGYIQITLILLAAVFLFEVPIYGSLWLLLIAALPFIAANLGIGLTFSSLVKNQLQSVQMAFFFFLPSILLSGFLFPFAGMPQWAQVIGSVLPLTHFVRIVRGIMLKGNDFFQVWPNIWPILIFFIIVMAIGIRRYRKTLD